jgi:hypothetical protein
MMFSEKLCAAIKSNGKILREFKDTVMIPFGSEYSVYLKNLNTVRALVNITIDGTDVAPGGLVLNGNQTLDLERFIKNGNLSEGNKFKFIERTANIEQHRGIGVEDGLIRVEYEFERIVPLTNWYDNTWHPHKIYGGGTLRGVSGAMNSSFSASAIGATVTTQSLGTPINDTGITVPGSHSDQKFAVASWFPTDGIKHAMVIRLLGETEEGRKIYQPVTVKHKPRCVTCNKQNRASAKFCAECGTALEIYA